MAELAFSINGTPIPVPNLIPSGGLNPTGHDILLAAINLVYIVGIVLAMVFLIWGGIRWSMSGGDPKAVEAARKQITYAIIGLVILLLSRFIVDFVAGFLDVQLFGP